MKKLNYTLTAIFTFIIIFSFACSSTQKGKSSFENENNEFLQVDSNAEEVFRVLLTSNKYIVSQMKYDDSIDRAKDPGGDRYMTEEMKKFDKLNEAHEGVLTIWLYPDSGQIMKIRPKKLIYLTEIHQLITDDIQRWSFQFPKKIVYPTKLDIKYRVVIQKKQTDEEIIKEVQKKMRESQ